MIQGCLSHKNDRWIPIHIETSKINLIKVFQECGFVEKSSDALGLVEADDLDKQRQGTPLGE